MACSATSSSSSERLKRHIQHPAAREERRGRAGEEQGRSKGTQRNVMVLRLGVAGTDSSRVLTVEAQEVLKLIH